MKNDWFFQCRGFLVEQKKFCNHIRPEFGRFGVNEICPKCRSKKYRPVYKTYVKRVEELRLGVSWPEHAETKLHLLGGTK